MFITMYHVYMHVSLCETMCLLSYQLWGNVMGLFFTHSDRVASLEFGLGVEPEHDLSTTFDLVLNLELS